jgi:hypothetical protein
MLHLRVVFRGLQLPDPEDFTLALISFSFVALTGGNVGELGSGLNRGKYTIFLCVSTRFSMCFHTDGVSEAVTSLASAVVYPPAHRRYIFKPSRR